MVKVIYFDLGGVVFSDFFSGGEKGLIEILGMSKETIMDAYQSTDIPAYPKGEVTDEKRWEAFTKELGLPKEKVKQCIDMYYQSYHPFPETVDFLKKLYEGNKYQLGVLSDQPIGITKYLREKYKNVFDLFNHDLIIISAEVKLSKKDTDQSMYKLAIERSKTTPNEVLFVDNSLRNIKDATSLGMDTFYFDIKNQPIAKLLNNLQGKLSDK